MTVRRPRRVTVDARAKLNLALAVGPIRPDGFHDLWTVFQSISLHDTLTAERAPRGFTLRIRHESAAVRGRWPGRSGSRVPGGGANLVIRAARRTAEALGLPGGARFTLVKRIPSQAGLGGGSADAAAAMLALARLHGRRWPGELARRVALELGSDVPFAFSGGTALGRGRGERLRTFPLDAPLRAVVVKPSWGISTSEAYARIDRMKLSLTSKTHERRFSQALGADDISGTDVARLGNTFEAVLGPHRTAFRDLCARLVLAGGREPRLTGSGSAVFALVPPGVRPSSIVSRFEGDEPLFVVRGTARGLRIRRLS